MLTKQTVLSQIEVLPDGTIQVRLDKQVVEDGNVLSQQFHRTSFPPGTDVDAQMDAVDEHLLSMGAAVPDKSVRARIKRIVAIEHTPAAVKAFRKASKAAAESASEP